MPDETARTEHDLAMATLVRNHQTRMQAIYDSDRERVEELGKLNSLLVYLNAAGRDTQQKIKDKVYKLVEKVVYGQTTRPDSGETKGDGPRVPDVPVPP